MFITFCRNHFGWNVAELPSPATSTPSAPQVMRFRSALANVDKAGDAATETELTSVIEQAFALKRGALREAEVVSSGAVIHLELDNIRHKVPRPLRNIVLRWRAIASRSRTVLAYRGQSTGCVRWKERIKYTQDSLVRYSSGTQSPGVAGLDSRLPRCLKGESPGPSSPPWRVRPRLGGGCSPPRWLSS